MIKPLAAAVLAIALTAALPARAVTIVMMGWSCQAAGERATTHAVPAPQREVFTDKNTDQSVAKSAAMSQCKASHSVAHGTCTAGLCVRTHIITHTHHT